LFLSNRISKPLQLVHDTLENIHNGDFSAKLDIRTKDEFGDIAKTVNELTLRLQQREDLKNALARYVSEDVMNEIVQSGKHPDLHGKRKKVTALFADLRDFSKLSEALSPEDTVLLLNHVFERIIDAVISTSSSATASSPCLAQSMMTPFRKSTPYKRPLISSKRWQKCGMPRPPNAGLS
jgi:adenylate cyclase